MRDFFAFRRMVTTVVIQVVFWIGVIAAAVTGIALIVYGVAGMTDTEIDIEGFVRVTENGGIADVLWGAVILLGGPILVRIICELFILFFRINETLTDILQNQRESVAAPVAGLINTPDVAVDAASPEQVSDLRTQVTEELSTIRDEVESMSDDVREVRASVARDDD